MADIFDSQRIVLHVGAHRTGTGSFQNFLKQNFDTLVEAGVSPRFSKRDVKGSGNLRLKLPDRAVFRRGEPVRPYIKAARKALLAGPTAGTMIVSEENCLGRMSPFYHGDFYSALWKRLAVLPRAFHRNPDHVVLVMRNYGELFVSAYAQLAQTKKVPKFEDTVENLQGIERGWPTVVDALHKGLKPTRVTVVPYAKRGSNQHLLDLMTDKPVSGLTDVAKATNVSTTTEAIEVLQAKFTAGEALTRTEIEQIKSDHSVENGGTPFNPFTGAQKSAFTRRYNADVKALTEDTRVEMIGL